MANAAGDGCLILAFICKIKTRIFLTLFILSLCITIARSQEMFTAGGGEATGTGGSVSSSMGQVACSDHSSNTGTYVSQGVQQAYHIPFAIITGISLHLSIYPNPTTDLLFLVVQSYEYIGIRYQLYNQNGQLLESKQLAGNRTTIAMGHLTAGTYVLTITQQNRRIKSFKIIKTN